MRNFLQKFDELAGLETENGPARWLERIAFAFLILMILTAPHSIAASQTAWIAGMFAWLVRLFIAPRPRLFRTALDLPLWAFFGWSAVTCAFSYAPDISVNKLRGAALFLIFYFVVNNLRNRRAAAFLGLALVFSCMVNVVWMPIQRLVGRGVEIHGVAAESPLAKALFIEGDTLLEANGRKLRTPEDLIAEIERSEITKVKFYRPDFEFALDVKRENLLGGATAAERLGIESWKKSRNWRSAGFFGHYATYAEVLQLIASLAFGLLIAGFLRRRSRDAEKTSKSTKISSLFTFHFSLFAFFCVALMALALLLTVTRASQLGFLISAAAILFAVGNRKLLLVSAAIILPIAIGGLVFLQQSRQVGFFDPSDDSIKYRQTMYRDGVRLWTSGPRHLLLGVGMDSIQKYWREWGLFDGGKMAMGHFHSTLLQLVVERGIPALILYLMIFGVYARALWQAIKLNKYGNWLDLGILLGCFGGAAGFFAASVVHYNFGDAEVLMVLFLLMGVGMRIAMSSRPSVEST